MQIMIATGRKRPSKEEESSDSNTGKLPSANSCHITFFSVFPPFFSDPLLLFSRYEKKLLQSIYNTKQEFKTIVKEATCQGRYELYLF